MFQNKRFFSTVVNKAFRLSSRPNGLPTKENWNFTQEKIDISKIDADGIVVSVSSVSLDPAMRGWMKEGKSYIPPVGINEVMRAIGIGSVVASNNPNFNVGDVVSGTFGVQEYCALQTEKEIKRQGVQKIDLKLGSETQWLNVLGMPGMTAYFGLNDIGQPKAGETLLVSAAAGAVGQTVGQLGKIYGLKVVGIAGGKEKCDWVVNELGFDSCIDYKASPTSVMEGLKTHCPTGVDIYFDNVGGEILDTALLKINKKARIIICGAISQYNNPNPSTSSTPSSSSTSPSSSSPDRLGGWTGPKNYYSLLFNRARMEGMVVFDYFHRYPQAIQELSGYLLDGRLQSKEHLIEGIEHFPEALNFLFTGKNFGKLVLRV